MRARRRVRGDAARSARPRRRSPARSARARRSGSSPARCCRSRRGRWSRRWTTRRRPATSPDVVTSLPPAPAHQRTPVLPLTPTLATAAKALTRSDDRRDPAGRALAGADVAVRLDVVELGGCRARRPSSPASTCRAWPRARRRASRWAPPAGRRGRSWSLRGAAVRRRPRPGPARRGTAADRCAWPRSPRRRVLVEAVGRRRAQPREPRPDVVGDLCSSAVASIQSSPVIWSTADLRLTIVSVR